MARSEKEMNFIAEHVCVRVGTSPVRYAIAKDNKQLTIVGPTRSTIDLAWKAALQQLKQQ